MLKFRIRRALVLERRDRRAKVEQLMRDVRTWDWWSFVLAWRVAPVLAVLFVAWSVGFLNGVSYITQEIDQRFTCEAKHAD